MYMAEELAFSRQEKDFSARKTSASQSLNWCYSLFTWTDKTKTAVYTLKSYFTLTISFRQLNSSYSESEQHWRLYFGVFIAWKTFEWPKCSNHQRGWVVIQSACLPQSKKRSTRCDICSQRVRARERERKCVKWDTPIITSSLSFPSFTYLFDPSVPYRTEKKVVTVTLEGELFP